MSCGYKDPIQKITKHLYLSLVINIYRHGIYKCLSSHIQRFIFYTPNLLRLAQIFLLVLLLCLIVLLHKQRIYLQEWLLRV